MVPLSQIRVQSSEAKADLTSEKRKRSQIRARRSETKADLTPENGENDKSAATSTEIIENKV